MSISFNNAKGSAIKNTEAYKYVDGENVVRLIGNILPRYLYWLKDKEGKDIPLECLAFDRDKEKFTNKEVDHVRTYFPELKCQWSYAINCIDPKDGKVKVLNLKKKLLQQIMDAAADGLGDPTDVDSGWDCVFKRVKSGPLAFNVEYNLSVLKLKKRALTPEERDIVAAADTIDVKLPRPTPTEIETICKRIVNSEESSEEDSTEESPATEAAKDL